MTPIQEKAGKKRINTANQKHGYPLPRGVGGDKNPVKTGKHPMSQDRSTFSSPSKFLSQKNKHMLAELVKRSPTAQVAARRPGGARGPRLLDPDYKSVKFLGTNSILGPHLITRKKPFCLANLELF